MDDLDARLELRLLRQLAVRRRASPEESWLDALIGAWVTMGRPGGFAHGVDWHEMLEEAFAMEGPEGILRVILEEASPLQAQLARGWLGEESADRAAVEALHEAWETSTLERRLWILAVLSSKHTRGPVAAEAARARAGLLRDLADSRPDDLRFSAAAIFEEAGEGAALSEGQVDALREALVRHRSIHGLGTLYDALVRERAPRSAAEARGCFGDAVSMLPDVILPLRMRLEATHASLGAARGGAFLEIAMGVAEAFRTAPMMSERLMAVALGEKVATLQGDAARRQTLAAELEWLRWLARPANRLPLEWPLEPLQRDVVDAVAHDECGLFDRTALPPDARH